MEQSYWIFMLGKQGDVNFWDAPQKIIPSALYGF